MAKSALGEDWGKDLWTPAKSHEAAQIETEKRPGAGALRETIMPDTRNTLFVMAAGAGFFLAMYQWVTMIAETMP